nr:MAG TPA: Protein of unknown function (DUF1492) [Caudoviricetes sp.]
MSSAKGKKLMINEKDFAEIVQAKSYLKEIEKADKIIKNKVTELKQLRELSTSITVNSNSDVVQTSCDADKIGSIVGQIIDKENDLKLILDEYISKRQERIAVIEELRDTVEYDIIHKRYVQMKSLDEIAIELGYSYVWICKKHNSALLNIQKIRKKK